MPIPSPDPGSWRVRSTDDEVLAAVGDLIAAMTPHGASLRTGGEVFHGPEGLGVRCARRRDETNLAHLPPAALSDVARAVWSDDCGRIVVNPLPDCPAPTKALLGIHTRVFNATDRLRWYRRSHPRGALAADDPLVSAITTVRPGFVPDPSVAGFLQTRTMAHGDERVLIGIVDLMNHHRRGARLHSDAAGLRIRVRQPVAGDECFVSYGGIRSGPLDRALGYGFADASSVRTRCAPLALTTSSGPVRILGSYHPAVSPLDPPSLTYNDGVLSVSHLTFDVQHPHRVVQLLTMAMTALQRPDPRGSADEIVTRAADTTLQRLHDLGRACAESASLEVGAVVARAVELERHVITDVIAQW